MKVGFILIALALSCDVSKTDDENNFETNLINEIIADSIGDKFKALLEDLKKLMRTGNSSLGIPVLDPLDIKHEEFKIQNEDVNVSGVLSDVYIEGLSNFVIQEADFKLALLKITVDFLWPNIVVKRTSYKVNGKAMDFEFFGEGDISTDVKNFHFATQATLKIDGKTKKVSVRSFNKTLVLVDKLQFDITGFFNNEDLSDVISKLVTNTVPHFLADKDNQEVVSAEVNKILIKEANKRLENVTLSEIIGKVG